MRQLCNITYAWQREELAAAAQVAAVGADLMEVYDTFDRELTAPLRAAPDGPRPRGRRAAAPARSSGLNEALAIMGMPTR